MYKLVLPIFFIAGIMGVTIGGIGVIDNEILEAILSEPVPNEYITGMLKMGVACLAVYFIGRYVVYLGKRN